MSFAILDPVDTTYLDHLLENNKLKIMPADFYKNIPQEHLSIWCHKNGIYGLTTIELIDWLKTQITDKTIEIGAGNGAVGRALKIPITDNYNMERPDIRACYIQLNQPLTKYPIDVEKLDAIKAIKKYKPDIVIACWVTHKYNPNNHLQGGNFYGIDEEYILKNVKKYILIGNDNVHSKKPIIKYKHQELSFDWLYSRSLYTRGNKIYIWDTNDI